MGLDKKETLGRSETGSRAAIPIWLQFMKYALKDKPAAVFPAPSDIVTMKIDPRTGLLAGDESKDGLFEIFREGMEPKEISRPREPRPADFYRFDM